MQIETARLDVLVSLVRGLDVNAQAGPCESADRLRRLNLILDEQRDAVGLRCHTASRAFTSSS